MKLVWLTVSGEYAQPGTPQPKLPAPAIFCIMAIRSYYYASKQKRSAL